MPRWKPLTVLRSDACIGLPVSDAGLPGGMNGRQMADAARQFRPGLKVLFITGQAENTVLQNKHLMPGMPVLTKPFSLGDAHQGRYCRRLKPCRGDGRRPGQPRSSRCCCA
jgi:CheY-like chemotaxis protein